MQYSLIFSYVYLDIQRNVFQYIRHRFIFVSFDLQIICYNIPRICLRKKENKSKPWVLHGSKIKNLTFKVTTLHKDEYATILFSALWYHKNDFFSLNIWVKHQYDQAFTPFLGPHTPKTKTQTHFFLEKNNLSLKHYSHSRHYPHASEHKLYN